MPTPITIFTAELHHGGTERQIVALAKGLRLRGHEVRVVSYGKGIFDEELIAAGVEMHYANRRGALGAFGFLWRLARLLRTLKPAVIYSFLGTPNIYLALLKPLLGGATIVWGVRASYVETSRYGIASSFAAWLEARLSRKASLIIANSHAGREWAIKRGFAADKIVVIENGIDTDRFKYDEEGRRRVRSEFGLKDHERLIVQVGRLDVMKDHPTFLKACAILAAEDDSLRFACVGGGEAAYSDFLATLADRLGLHDKLIWTGARDDISAIYSSSSASSSSSFGEGFSNTIAEAMSCGVVCAVTDVGDSALIVGDLGFVAPPRDPKALANALRQSLNLAQNDPDLNAKLRSSIESRFSLDRMVERTEAVLEQTRR
ncbi:glycosyl transferase [Campylobacterota bacterium]|nr:glycosyl transferase [Campylobacterota bacterium]